MVVAFTLLKHYSGDFMRPTSDDILVWTMCRKVLIAYAKMVASLNDLGEFNRLKSSLIAELEAIGPGMADSEIWRQATVAACNELPNSGVSQYIITRLGLWPTAV